MGGSGNKMLFLSCALFITLAVYFHLSPFLLYRPIHSNPPSQFRPSIQFSSSCFSSLIRFHHHNSSWDWDSDPKCDFHKFSQPDASDLLNGSWIVVAGDSQARFITLSLLSLLFNNNSVKSDLFKRHSNYQILLPHLGIKLDFIWAPFISNLTSFLLDHTSTRQFPDVLVMGSGLWHMLHVSNDSHYGASLNLMRNALQSSIPEMPPHKFWIGMPTLVNSMLNTPQKREKMSDVASVAYERQVMQSKILRQSGGGGGGPLLLLDLKTLTRNCGTTCTLDGMHYDQVVYEAAVHVMLNTLLIESNQML